MWRPQFVTRYISGVLMNNHFHSGLSLYCNNSLVWCCFGLGFVVVFFNYYFIILTETGTMPSTLVINLFVYLCHGNQRAGLRLRFLGYWSFPTRPLGANWHRKTAFHYFLAVLLVADERFGFCRTLSRHPQDLLLLKPHSTRSPSPGHPRPGAKTR